ncbi:MAG TPA: ABC transporter permease [Kofleriaceae bacterium]|nr:ABC transporter permease [Kofleriaceae bacterium]
MIAVLAREAMRSLARHPLRSTLTLLGFAIGVGAFVAMVSFAAGARRSVVAQFEALGHGTLVVTAGSAGHASARNFTSADARHLVAELDGVGAVAPLARQIAGVTAGGKRVTTMIFGTTPAFTEVRAWPLEAGGMFDGDDLRLGARVCVVGRTVADRLFGDRDVVGQRLQIGDVDCRVIGALASLGQTASAQDQDDVVLIPLPLFERRLTGRAGAERLLIGVVPGADPTATRVAVTTSLRARRRLGPGDPDDFTIKSPDDLTRVADRTAGLLEALLGAIAAVSLLVGGIGIMNILLVSVGERTREIGVRVALGATPGAVLTQFLIEASALSGLGATTGAVAGGVLAAVAGERLGWGGGVPLDLVALAVGGGVALGLVFGLYPARRAALLDPVVALRGE